MQVYLAPLESVTTHIYRNVHSKYYGKLDKYFTPFITPHLKKKYSNTERREIEPKNNEGLYVVPQILSNDGKSIINLIKEFEEFGYYESNLNFGCPSLTVTRKGRGSGIFKDLDKLDNVLYEVFSANLKSKISIKTRVGFDDYDLWPEILDIYNKYDMNELIIHTRLAKDMYKNPVNKETFYYAMKNTKIPLVYNGDIYYKRDCDELLEEDNNISKIMLGRGIIKRPTLANEIKTNNSKLLFVENKEEMKKFLDFHNELISEYLTVIKEDRNVLFKMKELWSYMALEFDLDNKIVKKIRKSQNLIELQEIIKTLSLNFIV